MPICENCGNDYDKAFRVILAGEEHVFDGFECAIHARANLSSLRNSDYRPWRGARFHSVLLCALRKTGRREKDLRPRRLCFPNKNKLSGPKWLLPPSSPRLLNCSSMMSA